MTPKYLLNLASALALLLTTTGVFAAATVEHDSAPIATPTYNIDLSQSSVSGISSGGHMAVNFHVANSAWMVGAAVVAGGPYFCAQNDVYNGYYRCADNAWAMPDLNVFLNEANNQAAAGRIDAVSNLSNDRVWLLHGKNDQGVKESVMDALRDWYQLAGVSPGNIDYQRERPYGHTWPTKYYSYPGDAWGNTNDCNSTDYPWMGECNYDAAGAMLQHIYGTLNPRNGGSLSGTVKAVRQSDHFNAGGYGSPSSMNPKAYVYVPDACENGASCKLHVAFHGCEMNYESAPSYFSSDAGPNYGLKFVLNSGLNEWADTNNIVVLYPQAKKYTFYPWTLFFMNPKGCWDFWNYEGGGRPHTQHSKQIDAIRDMMKTLAGES